MSRERWSDLETEERELLEQLGVSGAGDVSDMRSCPPPELLRASEEEMLPADVRAKLQAHLMGCRLCQALERDLPQLSKPDLPPDAGDRIRSRLPASTVRRQRPRSGWNAWWLPAVALAAAAVLAVIFVPRLQPGVVPPPTVAPAPQPEPARVAAALIPIEKPPVRLSPSVLVFRTPDSPSERILNDLEPAFDAYRSDDYATAERRFAELNGRYSGLVEVQFYLGICRLFLNEYRGAVSALEAAQKLHDPTFSEHVAWYLMAAYQRAGDLQAADRARLQICDGHGAYSSKACAARVR